MLVQSYLFMDGRCEEAVNFYREALGAQIVMMMRMKDSPEPCSDAGNTPGFENKIMHVQFSVGDTVIMASDGRCENKTQFQGFALSLSVNSAADAEKYFTALSAGGQVQMPLSKTFFAKSFGMVTDKFGVMWMVMARE